MEYMLYTYYTNKIKRIIYISRRSWRLLRINIINIMEDTLMIEFPTFLESVATVV